MNNKVSLKRLGDIVNFKRGYDLPSYNRRDGQYPILSSSGISGYHAEYKIEGEGLVTGRYGTLGEVYYINGKYWPHNTALYVTDFKGNHPKYVYYLMKCLGNLKTSDKSTVPGINRNDLHEIVIPYIEPKYQKPIATVLSALDGKIELNQRINAELEQVAKTLYDYWFVQFDFPNEKGQPYKSAGGKMVWDEKLYKEIPDGWLVKPLGKVLKTNLGGTPSTKNPEYWENATIPWLNSGDLVEFPIIKPSSFVTKKGVDNSATTILPKGSVVISLVRYIRPSIIALEACANQSVVGIRETEEIKSAFIYPYLVNEVPRLMSLRTGAQQPHINKETIDDSPLCIPPVNILKEYYKISEPIYKKIINVAFESQTLTELRDWLLPMLMNGQVTVNGL
jgi:type I restriction enzyme S subunit